MKAIPVPDDSEKTSKEAEETHNLWFIAKVKVALANADSKTSQRFTSDEIARKMDALIKTSY